MRKELLYEQPDCELLVVRFEGNLMQTNGLPDSDVIDPFGEDEDD